MSQATFTFGRFNPPTESGHGKLISAVQAHAEKAGGKHYIFPSHSQDAKKNPLSHGDKVGAMQKLFPNANVVSHNKVRTAIDAMKHLEKQGYSNVTMVVGSDRVAEFHGLLSKYRKKEFPGIKKVNVVSAGNRDPDAEGAEGMSASKLRGLVAAGKKKEFVTHYSDPKLGAHIHDKIKAGMQMESVSPVGIFLLGGPGSGKDYVLKNIFSHFDLTEVQADQILNGVATELVEQNKHIVINGVSDESKITIIQNMLEGYNFDYVHVSVTNKVSRLRNEQREQPLVESKRIDKFLKAEQVAQSTEAFIFNNSINLNESSELEKVFFADQIEKLLERVTNLGLEMKTKAEPKAFSVIKEKYFPPVAKDKASGLPKKYVRGLSPSTAKARASHWKEKSKLSDSDPRAYEPAPGDATAKTKPSKHTVAVRKMMGEQMTADVKKPQNRHIHQAAMGEAIRRVPRSGNITAVNAKRELNNAERAAFEKAKMQLATSKVQEETIEEGDNSIAAKAKKTGISVGTLRKVYNRGVAAWNSGHRPGTTPQQWGHARVNSYINKGKTYHTADKDLREDADINELFEMQLVGTDEYRKHAIAMTPGQGEPVDAFPVKSPNKKPVAVVAKPGKSIVSQYEEHTNCGTPDCCGECEQTGGGDLPTVRKFSELRKEAKEKDGKDDGVETEPTLTAKHKKGALKRPNHYDYTLQGLPVTARFNAYEEKKPQEKAFMPTPRQIPAPAGGHSVPKGYKRVKDHIAGWKLVKEEDAPELTLEEAVSYHIENKISFTENVFRPGSEMFFEMISEAKKLYKEGKYTPTDEYEVDMLNSDIGEIAEYEGQAVVLDYPIEEGLEECWTGYTQRGMKKKGNKMVPNCVPVNEEEQIKEDRAWTHEDEYYMHMDTHADAMAAGNYEKAEIHAKKAEAAAAKHFKTTGEKIRDAGYTGKSTHIINEEDKTDGKGIGKPFRSNGGGAVYVRVGDGVRKINFSQSGMTKKFNDPAATRSFVARHHCLSNKDKTSRSYWACRWPRFFSNSGKTWW